MPIVHWLPRYRRSYLRGDIIAGLSVWALMVPEAMGYATIAGVPVVYGIYAGAISLVLYAILGSTRQVITGPSSTVAAVTGGAVIAISATAGSEEAIQIASTVAFLAGVLYLILRVFRMGWISNFLSESVLIGFVFGIAIEILIGQFGKIFGYTLTGNNTWTKLWDLITNLSDIDPITVVLGTASLAILVGLRFFAPKVPGSLIVLLLGIGISRALDLSDHGVAVVGTVPTGFPTPALPDVDLLVDNFGTIAAASIGVVAVGFSESLSAARQMASRHNYDVDINQEMLAQGVANTSTGLFQSISVAGSLSKTSLNDDSDANTQMASLIQAGLVLLTLALLAPFFQHLPEAVLAAIVIVPVAFGMMNFKALHRIYLLSKPEFRAAMAALLGVITFGTLPGVLIGIVFSLIVLVRRVSSPSMPLLGREQGSQVFHNLEYRPDCETFPGVAIFRFDGPIYFANANILKERTREIVNTADPPIELVILDLETTTYIDIEGVDMLGEIEAELRNNGIDLALARVYDPVMDLLETTEVIGAIGQDRIYLSVHHAVSDFNQTVSVSGENG